LDQRALAAFPGAGSHFLCPGGGRDRNWRVEPFVIRRSNLP